MRCKLLLVLALLLSFTISVYAQNSKKLAIVGTVVATERLLGHIYDSKEIHHRFLLVKVDKINKGTSDSEYLLVNYLWRLRDEASPTDREDTTQWNFSLTREKACDHSMREAQVVRSINDGKPAGLEPRFMKTRTADIRDLSFERVLPCYTLEDKDASLVQTFPFPERDKSGINPNRFLLEKDIWKTHTDSPMQIQVLGGRIVISMGNISDRKVRSYKTACVNDEEKSFYKISDILEEKGEFLPHSFQLTPDDSLLKQLEICYDKNTYLSVVEAVFEDGSTWTLK